MRFTTSPSRSTLHWSVACLWCVRGGAMMSEDQAGLTLNVFFSEALGWVFVPVDCTHGTNLIVWHFTRVSLVESVPLSWPLSDFKEAPWRSTQTSCASPLRSASTMLFPSSNSAGDDRSACAGDSISTSASQLTQLSTCVHVWIQCAAVHVGSMTLCSVD